MMVAYHSRDIELSKVLIKQVTMHNEERRDDIATLMTGIYRGLADIVIAGQNNGALRKSADPMIAAQSFFSIYYLGLIGWLGGHATKDQFLRRLRNQLGALIDGLSQRLPAKRGPKA